MNILLHDDWEIYGDGSGDPQKLMFDPAKRLLDLCDTYCVKYTFYAEIGQQLNMLDTPDQKWRKYANTWEAILRDAVRRGHDVQLHFHPQWAGAKLAENQWQLNHNNWHSGHVDAELLNEWIGKGKHYLEQLLKPINPEYQVLSYRAGGWLCQPSSNLYNALKNNDIVCDVSVMKGRYQKYSDGRYVDFRHAVSRFVPWEVHPDDFASEQKGSGIWELPVFTEESALPHPVYLIKKAFRPRYYYRIYQKRKLQKGSGSYYPKIVERSNIKEYYGSFGYMHYFHLYDYIKKVLNNSDKQHTEYPHIIFLTHSKSFLDFKNFELLLKKLSSYKRIQYITTQRFIQKFIPYDKKSLP